MSEVTIPQIVCPLCKAPADDSGRCLDCKQNLAPLAYLDARASVYYNRALDLAAQGDDAGATSAAQAAVAADDHFADAWVVLGKLHRKSGRTAEARRAWESALSVAPDHRGAQDALDALGPEEAPARSWRGVLAALLVVALVALVALVLWLLLRPAPVPDPGAPATGVLTVGQRAGSVALTGSVPDDAALQQVRDAAAGAAGTRHVDTTALVVDRGSVAPPVDGPAVARIVTTLSDEPGADVSLVVTPTRAIVSGTFPDDDARTRVITGLRADVPGREVSDQARLGPPSGTTDAQAVDGAIQAVQQAAPIRFGPSDATLTPPVLATIRAIASVVRGRDVAVEVDGFTAPIGPPDGAQAISANRAGAVRDALVAGGVPADHVRVRALGDSQPLPSPEASRRATVRAVPAG